MISIIRAEGWDRHRYAQGVATLLMILSTLVVALSLYAWAVDGKAPNHRVLIPVRIAIAPLVAVPRKFAFGTQMAGGHFVLSLLGAILGRGGGTFLQYMEILVPSGLVFLVLYFIGKRLKPPGTTGIAKRVGTKPFASRVWLGPGPANPRHKAHAVATTAVELSRHFRTQHGQPALRDSIFQI